MDDKAKSIERANSYRQMFELWAWKDLVREIEEMKKDARNGIENIDVDKINSNRTAEYIGFMKAFSKIENHLGYVTSEQRTK